MALMDNGAQVNTITPKYVSNHLLQMGPITDLIGCQSHLCGVGQCLHEAIGLCIIIWVQVDRGQGFDEDQIALVMLDLSNFVAHIPVILGTPTISQAH